MALVLFQLGKVLEPIDICPEWTLPEKFDLNQGQCNILRDVTTEN